MSRDHCAPIAALHEIQAALERLHESAVLGADVGFDQASARQKILLEMDAIVQAEMDAFRAERRRKVRLGLVAAAAPATPRTNSATRGTSSRAPSPRPSSAGTPSHRSSSIPAPVAASTSAQAPTPRSSTRTESPRPWRAASPSPGLPPTAPSPPKPERQASAPTNSSTPARGPLIPTGRHSAAAQALAWGKLVKATAGSMTPEDMLLLSLGTIRRLCAHFQSPTEKCPLSPEESEDVVLYWRRHKKTT